MKKILTIIALLLATDVAAVELAGVTIAAQVKEAGQTLQLNGSGIRSKFFIKVYVGSLYATTRLTTPEQVLADPGAKLVRMQFVHSKVDKEKIVAAFAEGLANNAPEVAATPAARQFLNFFSNDFYAGETVDLFLASDGNIIVRHAGRELGTLRSAELARGILAIYVGEQPADEDLKQGLLGR